MSWGFIGTFLGLKAKQQAENIVVAMGTKDPALLSEAQLIEMEKDVQEAAQLFARAKLDWQREEREADEAERMVHRTIAAAEEIQRRLTVSPVDATEAQRNELQAALETVVTRLEEVKLDADKERQEADEAHTFVTECEAVTSEKMKAILAAKDNLKKLGREAQRANMHAEMEERRAETAKELAGLRDGAGSGLNSANAAFRKSIEQAEQRAEAARIQAQQIKAVTQDTGNAMVTEVLKQVEGRGLDSGLSASERLAKLTGKTQPMLENKT